MKKVEEKQFLKQTESWERSGVLVVEIVKLSVSLGGR